MKSYILIITFLVSSIFFTLAQSQHSVYIFVAEECPVTIYMTTDMKKSSSIYNENFNYFAVFPKKNSTKETAEQFLSNYELNNFSIILDTDQELASKLGAKVTPEAVIVNKNKEILYRGRINDAYFAPGRKKHRADTHDLRTALSKIMKGIPVKEEDWKTAIGCFITFHN